MGVRVRSPQAVLVDGPLKGRRITVAASVTGVTITETEWPPFWRSKDDPVFLHHVYERDPRQPDANPPRFVFVETQ